MGNFEILLSGQSRIELRMSRDCAVKLVVITIFTFIYNRNLRIGY